MQVFIKGPKRTDSINLLENFQAAWPASDSKQKALEYVCMENKRFVIFLFVVVVFPWLTRESTPAEKCWLPRRTTGKTRAELALCGGCVYTDYFKQLYVHLQNFTYLVPLQLSQHNFLSHFVQRAAEEEFLSMFIRRRKVHILQGFWYFIDYQQFVKSDYLQFVYIVHKWTFRHLKLCSV